MMCRISFGAWHVDKDLLTLVVIVINEGETMVIELTIGLSSEISSSVQKMSVPDTLCHICQEVYGENEILEIPKHDNHYAAHRRFPAVWPPQSVPTPSASAPFQASGQKYHS